MSFEGHLKTISFAAVESDTAFDARTVKGRCRLVGFSLTPQYLSESGTPGTAPNPNGTVKLEDLNDSKTGSSGVVIFEFPVLYSVNNSQMLSCSLLDSDAYILFNNGIYVNFSSTGTTKGPLDPNAAELSLFYY
tara:strand:- start:318 stop:719 length:402 start_codon:yes stop_codon:yes gene_type:complete